MNKIGHEPGGSKFGSETGNCKSRCRDSSGGKEDRSNAGETQRRFKELVTQLQTDWEAPTSGKAKQLAHRDKDRNAGAEILIAESFNPMKSIAPPVATAGAPSHPLTEKVEQIARLLMERIDLTGTGKIDGSGVRLVLDKATFGVSGVSLSFSPTGVSVALEGLDGPVTGALALAGQSLVLALQKHYPNRTIKIVAKGDENPEEPASTIRGPGMAQTVNGVSGNETKWQG